MVAGELATEHRIVGAAVVDGSVPADPAIEPGGFGHRSRRVYEPDDDSCCSMGRGDARDS